MPTELNHTIIIVAITVIISFIAFSNRKLQQQLIFYPLSVKKGQYQRFVTHGFIHADGNHLLFNMFTLFSFGSTMEVLYNQYLGGFGFYAFYLSAIAVAIFPSYLKNCHNPNYASLGASGAVSALLFAYILVAPWNMLYFFGVIPIPAIVFAVLYLGYSIYAQKRARDNINHNAHLWGAAYGIAVTVALRPDFATGFVSKLMHPDF